ncbi:MAG: hypothetical protein ACOCQA_00670 [bacterium]
MVFKPIFISKKAGANPEIIDVNLEKISGNSVGSFGNALPVKIKD